MKKYYSLPYIFKSCFSQNLFEGFMNFSYSNNSENPS